MRKAKEKKEKKEEEGKKTTRHEDTSPCNLRPNRWAGVSVLTFDNILSYPLYLYRCSPHGVFTTP
jgi:hypothetical protein